MPALLAVLAVAPAASAQIGGAGVTPAQPAAPTGKPLPPVAESTPDPATPAAAARAGAFGDTVVRVTVDKDGKVTASEIVTDPGGGLGEALRVASLAYRFRPATLDGQPIVARVLFRFTFREPGKVRGELKNGADEKALVGARVTLLGPDGVSIDVRSDASGRFVADRLPTGKHQLRIEAKGFQPTTATVDITAGDVASARFALAPEGGAVAGRVRVAGLDVAVAGAELTVVGPDGKERTLVADDRGAFDLGTLSPGRYTFRAKAPGYKDGERVVDVQTGFAYDPALDLIPDDGGIQVTVQTKKPSREVTKRTIERREIERVPGTGGDALRAILSLPGLARPPGLAGLLIVRGSGPQDTETFVDGSSVPLIYHFGGLSSVIPTELLERIDFYPGNFSARYGRRQGGIVDVGLRAPDTRCVGPYGKPLEVEKRGCFRGLVKVDLIDGRFLVEGPVPLLEGWTFAAAGRRSWIDAWIGPVLEGLDAGVTSAPVYYDYQLIAERRLGPNTRISVRGFGSDDRLELLIKNPLAQDPGFGGTLSFGTASHRAQVLYETKLNPWVDLETMFSVGKNIIGFSIGNFLFDLNVTPINLRNELGFKLARSVKVNTGLDFQIQPFEVNVRAPPPPAPGQADPGPFTTRPPLESRATETAFRPSWYLEAELTPTSRLRIVPGLRYDYYRDTLGGTLSPRISARYDVVPGKVPSDDGTELQQLRTTVKGGAGVYTQPPEFQQTNAVFGTPGIGANRSIHYSLGFEQEFSRHVELSMEGFYKDLTHQVARSANASGAFTYNNFGVGKIYGAETLLKYKPDQRFFGWLAYTLSRSERQDTETSEKYLFQYDQTHILTVLGSYRFGNGWEAGARFRVVSGSLTTPVLSLPSLPAVYAANAGAYTPLEGKPFSRRLPLFHALDVRIDRTWQFQWWRLGVFLDVQNIYNNPAVEGLVYNFDYSQVSYQTGLPILPSLGVKGDF